MWAAEVLAVEARRLGVRPMILYMPEWAFFESQKLPSASDANAISRVELAAAAASDGYILVPESIDNIQRREQLPESHQRAYNQTVHTWSRVLKQNSVPCVNLLAALVSKGAARQLGVDYGMWQRESLQGSLVPPNALRRAGKPLARRLEAGRRVLITHPNGTHLELGLIGRPAFIDDGKVDERDLQDGWGGTAVPGGYLGVAVDERIAEGRIVSNRILSTRNGRCGGYTWTFRDGRLVRYEVGTGRRLFELAYRNAGRERDRPAVLQIGLNPKLRDFPLTEDQEEGVVTVAIGRNDYFGGRTSGSFTQYALIRGADVYVDDKPLLRGGRRV
jgi:leucyl aminopeptidase (aminopeptidase T)